MDFTPACSDHPRSCGANRACRSLTQCRSGSSPLVRGQLQERISKLAHMRIIPARAGPTAGAHQQAGAHADHPRSCGANQAIMLRSVRVIGSSPLVRGQPAERDTAERDDRIIPARAGPTMPESEANARRADHPRSCGANRTRHRTITRRCGSSPLVRGQLRLKDSFFRCLRIIPARAGPTIGR